MSNPAAVKLNIVIQNDDLCTKKKKNALNLFEHILLHDLSAKGIGTSSEKLKTPSSDAFNILVPQFNYNHYRYETSPHEI